MPGGLFFYKRFRSRPRRSEDAFFQGFPMKKSPKPQFPKPPKTLGAEGRKLWKRIAEAYNLDEAAMVFLETACLFQDRASGATAVIAEKGIAFTDRWGQLRPNPACQIERDSRAGKLRALKQIGLDLEPLHDRPGRPAGR